MSYTSRVDRALDSLVEQGFIDDKPETLALVMALVDQLGFAIEAQDAVAEALWLRRCPDCGEYKTAACECKSG